MAHTRELLPDAVYTTWSKIRSSLKRAIAHPPAEPVVPGSLFAAYAGTPLVTKLGIKENSIVGLVGAPEGFARTLRDLPEGAVLREHARGPCDVVLWFTRSRSDLERRIGRVSALTGTGALWILWPKASAGRATDLSQAAVRAVGLAAGLVDYKVSVIDATWAGLLFTRRKAGQRSRPTD